MADLMTSRRALLGSMAVAPVALAAAPSVAVAPRDDRWLALVADYRAKRAANDATCSGEDDAMPAFRAALPPEPTDPGSNLPDDIEHMTLAQIKASGNDPAHKAAWVAYKRHHAAWAETRDRLRDEIVGPAKRRHDEACRAYMAAFEALVGHRATSLPALVEKIGIVRSEYDGCDVPLEYLDAILADVRHLSGEA